MTDGDGLVRAYLLNGAGGGRPLDWPAVRRWAPDEGFLWVHLDRAVEPARRWLEAESGLSRLACEALLAEDTRPRSAEFEDGLIVILRGVNLNPGADPEDMVSIRLWIDRQRVISVRLRQLMAVSDLCAGLDAAKGPRGPADFLVDLAARLVERMGPVIDDFEDEADAVENAVLTSVGYELRGRLADLRRRVIALRRYIAPQRDVMARLVAERVPWLDDLHRMRLRETADRITRYVEDLDAVRDRAAVTQDELSSRLGEQMNRNMYVLAIVAGVFLPLGLLTGLLGINVGGIPGADTSWAFAAVAIGIGVLGAIELWALKRFGWI
ncbi:zinc transporter ZntB [Shumkonia mesophila]|uniref:zinc transporter ZntB n=1 Tax=Shumkonia mesophila TaxID=2838854 RepID=UPI002934F6FA|nr:zinc transporter ZntB [Shumkonia mesophila]